ncbi:MAG: low molecular weight phosphatase family protein [Thermoplasmata archaeon]|nr:low molecular weight phosphatase family protein [Thermoplasmata archaeon]MCI4337733.1 low molecular weight phosphatase family protein [Thermoplasmata archaeon]MCI4340877.1 low molecular weight phosphatase family protein [Thermoplasmata archaeon]
MPVVLFLCVGNAARSLMAEAIFNAEAPAGWHAESAGTRPAAHANPRLAAMLAEIGLSVPAHAPRAVTPEQSRAADLRVSMGCLDDESCPAYLAMGSIRDWALPDPARLDDAGFRRVRGEIQERVHALVRELTADGAPGKGSSSLPEPPGR